MHKIVKRILIVLLILVLLFAGFLVAWVYLLFPYFAPNQDAADDPMSDPAAIAEESEQIDFNEEEGLLYINNEIVIFVQQGTGSEDVAALSEDFDAQLDSSMGDIDVYKLIFSEAMTYEELTSLQRRIDADKIVEQSYLNLVSVMDADTIETDEDTFAYQEPYYPVDDWNGAAWNVAVPRDENWGMEAINAPGAWGYLDSISEVNVGLIDAMPNTAHEDLTFASGNVSCLFIDEKTGLTSVNKYTLSPEDHGSHVAGIMAADWDDGTGVAGVMGGKGNLHFARVSYEKNGHLSSEKYATAYSYLLALKTLIDQDVQVINISQNTSRLVGFAASHGNEKAINYLTQQAELTQRGLSRLIEARTAAGRPDFVICIAAGNSNSTYYYKDNKQPYGYREEMTTGEKAKSLFGWKGEIGDSLALYNNFLNLMDTPEVKDRVIVVGAIQINSGSSTSRSTVYSYTAFSNVGERVDIVAPGYDIYSCLANGYDALSGTSMATPHVAGVAGLVFGCNPDLTGPQVKEILLASTKGRYYYHGGYSGLIDAETAVINALQTRESSVERVLRTEGSDGLDLCFVVDTTGSMGDDIDNAKENMAEILEHLEEKTANYRVAIVDYRDFASRSGDSSDYPCRVQLRFTENESQIIAAINALDLGYGGDEEETVYSGLYQAIRLDWRDNAKKVIILLGDAAPLDPEPETNLTYDQVLLALYNADISLDYDDSDTRVTDAIDDYLINVFSIGADASSDAADFFEQIAENTGGSYADVSDASEVGDAIISSIEQIEVDPKVTITADFGDSLSNRSIDLYSDGEFLFSFDTDDQGRFVIDAIDPETYQWECPELYTSGTIMIDEDEHTASARSTKAYWFTSVQLYWQQHRGIIFLYAAGAVVICILLPAVMAGIRKSVLKKKCSKSRKISDPVSGTQCSYCGAQMKPGEKFCSKCGRSAPPGADQ